MLTVQVNRVAPGSGPSNGDPASGPVQGDAKPPNAKHDKSSLPPSVRSSMQSVQTNDSAGITTFGRTPPPVCDFGQL